ncbi:S-adenosylmethionine sensor upstream of mTORC1 isoform X2 [Topomyia yanbarensis]|uniref:S-adenosylmethionine sensor upstream of mTORC1 isoform X2 n=1 Tax=Topomyia yanbarensis TaxID=2498891 RepID=UPI00273CBE45|nr:S-adenosylmethionine sensor upstream of mTORC1 isoform X2 [Topomyia yanbarensis]
MASAEQLALSQLIKSVHQQLRDSTKSSEPVQVWREHLNNRDLLKQYAHAMHTLATCHWDKNMEISSKQTNSRIEWVVNSCRDYFFGLGLRNFFREKEDKIMKTINPEHTYFYDVYETQRINLLDVGSCYNPFAAFADFDVTAIDIAPANDTVRYCDFLETPLDSHSADSLTRSHFDAVVFSLLLEYLPSSDQRLQCCQKAYDVLKPEGILLVITPDSCHQGANAKLMKNWRYTLGLMGFSRIKLEKLEHVTCMVFRKSVFKEVPQRWCAIHKEGYMQTVLSIPQDFNTSSLSGAKQEDYLSLTTKCVERWQTK